MAGIGGGNPNTLEVAVHAGWPQREWHHRAGGGANSLTELTAPEGKVLAPMQIPSSTNPADE